MFAVLKGQLGHFTLIFKYLLSSNTILWYSNFPSSTFWIFWTDPNTTWTILRSELILTRWFKSLASSTKLFRYSASVTLSLTYGKVTPTLLSDPEVHALNMLVCRLGDCLRIGAYFVETFPFLQYLPIPEVKKLQQYHHEELALFKDYIKTVRENMVSILSDDIGPLAP